MAKAAKKKAPSKANVEIAVRRARAYADMEELAAATGRRRVFLRCAETAVRKAEQGAGLKYAKESEIDDEILVTLEKVIKAWTDLRDKILNMKSAKG